ncbi:MAG: HlyD family efflux transporter periplasmic adaptor subunit [Planctomycetales bacterium]|nr:HlyD family efflux transporter periplasmic adaptor subunit [Planctomycetales bacterium]
MLKSNGYARQLPIHHNRLMEQMLSFPTWFKASPVFAEFVAIFRVSGRLASLLLAFFICGCTKTQSPPHTLLQTGSDMLPASIVAQGQILPAGGVIQISAVPGDTVEQIFVKSGDTVLQGQKLVEMRSEKVRLLQRQALEARMAEAAVQREQAIAQAQAQQAAAEIQVQQVELKRQALAEQKELLQLAEEQMLAAREILNRLRTIHSDPQTAEFMGDLEIQRQTIAVRESEIEYRRLQQSSHQMEIELQSADVAANLELSSAIRMLQFADQSRALDVLDAELKVVDEQIAAATLVSPINGTVVGVNATEGEASLQLPLIELAQTSQMVCEAEVYQTDAAYIRVGQKATLHSPVFETPLKGTVQSRGPLVGHPQLKPPNPLARSDYRVLNVVIQIEPQFAASAADWLQLQVDVEIEL